MFTGNPNDIRYADIYKGLIPELEVAMQKAASLATDDRFVIIMFVKEESLTDVQMHDGVHLVGEWNFRTAEKDWHQNMATLRQRVKDGYVPMAVWVMYKGTEQLGMLPPYEEMRGWVAGIVEEFHEKFASGCLEGN